jgi:mono/diheme cytochrome c family protein
LNRGLYQISFMALALIAALGGCRREQMGDGSYQKPFKPTDFFANHNSTRPLVEGTVSRSGMASDAYGYDRTPMSTSSDFAVSVSADFPKNFPQSGEPLRRRLERGQERFNIYCAACHGRTGAADGMIVQRGFIQPPAFYPIAGHEKLNADLFRREQNLLNVPPGYIYDKITNGYGAMYSYAARVTPEDRWNIAAYIRVLQVSQSAKTADLSPEDRAAVMAVASTGKPEEHAHSDHSDVHPTAASLPVVPATTQATEGQH